MQTHRRNQSYKFGCMRSEVNKIFQDPKTADRHYMKNQMKNHIDYLDQHGIFEYQNFAQTLHEYIKNDDIQKFIQSFVDYKNKTGLSDSVFMLKQRELKKTNICEKNILLNRIALEYSKEFLLFFENYLKLYYPFMKTKNTLVESFKSKIEKLIGMEKSHKKDPFYLILNDFSTNVQNSMPKDHEVITNDDFFVFRNDDVEKIIYL